MVEGFRILALIIRLPTLAGAFRHWREGEGTNVASERLRFRNFRKNVAKRNLGFCFIPVNWIVSLSPGSS